MSRKLFDLTNQTMNEYKLQFKE